MITSQLASYGGGLLALYLFLFIAPLVLGFYVAAQGVTLQPLRGFVAAMWVTFLLIVVLGVIVMFANFTEFNFWAPQAIQP
jgi:hypothetical protein